MSNERGTNEGKVKRGIRYRKGVGKEKRGRGKWNKRRTERKGRKK